MKRPTFAKGNFPENFDRGFNSNHHKIFFNFPSNLEARNMFRMEDLDRAPGGRSKLHAPKERQEHGLRNFIPHEVNIQEAINF